jgi:hypothetical protein
VADVYEPDPTPRALTYAEIVNRARQMHRDWTTGHWAQDDPWNAIVTMVMFESCVSALVNDGADRN